MDDERDDASPPSLDALRDAINAIDQRLIEVISERARIVQAIGQAKKGDGTPIYVPHREREVLDRVLALNPGPLPDRTIEAIYRELMSGSFLLERPLRVGFLGPRGSFSHLATRRHFGGSVELVELATIEAVFVAVASGALSYGMVPYENSIGGGITDTLDALLNSDVTLYAESLIGVVMALMSNSPPESIHTILSKPQVFSQCRRWLAANYPNAELLPMPSSSAAAARAATQPGMAAIGSALAAELYTLEVLAHGIQDSPNNVTRFLVLGRDAAQPTGDDKTTLMFVTANKPGALVDVLNVFRDAGINLTHIDKRPSQRTNWEYTFFVDCEAHGSEPHMQQAIEDAQEHCLALEVLGSYPRAQRIL